ncbi:MAG: RNA methyltransferase [Anaerolineae bacterium]|nr:RNA methyltransferase [Anaerolineae bacterium]
MITSPANEKVKYARALRQRRQRAREGRFLIEGVRLLEEAMRAGCIPALLFFQPEQAEDPRAQALLARARAAGTPCYAVSEPVLRSLSETVTPQPLVAVVPQPRPQLPALASLVLVVDRLRDPGNLGTILRTAAAAGVDAVLLGPGTVDVYSPKVVRAGMGAHFRLPLAVGVKWPQIAERLHGLNVWLADARGEQVYDAVDWRKPAALIIGGEAAGASDEAAALAQGRLRIPMHGDTESLNAAVAAAVILFEAARQRRAR